VGLTEAKEEGKAISHFKELSTLTTLNKRFFQGRSS
jgi:hypothetical protein